jgi:peptidoglycan hydrolase-like protein with peptidoglycan-binding domain
MKRIYVSGLAGLVGLVLGVAILALAAAPAAAADVPLTRSLAQGAGMGTKPDADVRSLQRILRAEGRSLGPAGVDGRFGPATAEAVRSLQRSFGLPADGVVGQKTRKLVRVVCRADACVGGNKEAGNRARARGTRPRGTATGSGQLSPSDDPGTLRDAAPTAAVVLAILLAALAYSRWRRSREAREYAAPATSFPAVRPMRRQRRRVVGYLGAGEYRVTAAHDEAQQAWIEYECGRRGWALLDVLREVPGGGREALDYALDIVDAGDATCIVVTNVESVAGSAATLARVLVRLKKAGACFVALDGEIDTTTREGAIAASLLVSVTKGERERLAAGGGNARRRFQAKGDVLMN